ncbi:hypothetical protein M0R72_17900 [Candidatus Pacearchaeota archaeon]|jgi:hypothetical protein|nr:hypothetical protein [Candidatus Pacearchaeota archaeon]
MGATLFDGKERPGLSLPDHINNLQIGLNAQVAKVRETRAAMESRTQEYHNLLCEFNLRHKELIAAKCKAQSDCSQAEAELRKLTLEAYHQTGEKKPAQGVGIRITKSLSYDETAAKAWALKENQGFLVLDREGFEAYAKALLKMKRSIPGILLQEEDRPQATIAKEL